MSDAGDRSNAAQAEYWDELTESWLLAEAHSGLVAGPFGDVALSRLAPVPGERILDIGCGSGPTTVAIAAAVASHNTGRDGSVVGIDIAPGMLHVARRRAADGRVPATFRAADAQTAHLDGPFDAAYSRFGCMFFSDPVAAFGNIASSLVEGGRLAMVCWRDLFQNEWMFVPGSAAIGVTGEFPPMPGPGEPGPFSLAEPDLVRQILADAGWTDIDVEQVTTAVVLPEHAVESITEMSRHVGPVHEALRSADDSLAQRILDAVEAALRGKVVDGELRLSAAANVVTARVSRR